MKMLYIYTEDVVDEDLALFICTGTIVQLVEDNMLFSSPSGTQRPQDLA